MESVSDDVRRSIAVLTNDVVERIAAGEVIERPASVARELIENALDAGATSIRIELRDGGMRLVRVADDGVGIAADELALAVAAHATSKLQSLPDLAHLRTLGFRGEALASIAAVAEVHISSAADNAGLAHTLAIRAGSVTARGHEARPRGTTVSVRDLFHNVPARRAILRGPRYEAARCLGVVRAYTLAHPGVRFIAIVDGTIVLQTPGTSPEAAVEAVYGMDVRRALACIGPLQLEETTLTGWIAPRAFSQADRTHVLVCVNGRPISNRALVAAAEAGYRPLLRKGRHPIALVHLHVQSDRVDVNIHPAKAEVLIHGERALAPSVRDAIHTALGKAPTQINAPLAGPLTSYGHLRQAPLPPLRRRRTRQWVGEPRARYAHLPTDDDAWRLAERIPALEPLGQLDHALIVAACPDGHLYLVDQHRAHERVLYEALRDQRPPGYEPGAARGAAAGTSATEQTGGQLLLEPLVVELSTLQAELLASRLDALHALGLVCEPFGGATFLVRAVPAVPGAATSAASFATELASDAAEDTNQWFEHVRTALACRGALRRGQPLSRIEQQALLTDLGGTEAPAVCPHGSPIILRYTQRFLARIFEW